QANDRPNAAPPAVWHRTWLALSCVDRGRASHSRGVWCRIAGESAGGLNDRRGQAAAKASPLHMYTSPHTSGTGGDAWPASTVEAAAQSGKGARQWWVIVSR